jgi:adenine-specific DNA-methyltransferase
MISLGYIGSKKSLIERIQKILSEHLEKKKHKLSESVFFDGFAGTGIVGYSFKSQCKKIIANDLEYYSFIINKALLCVSYSKKLQEKIDYLNSDLEINKSSTENLVLRTYSTYGAEKRMFFTTENALKCDAVRQKIDQMYEDKQITLDEKCFLIASLLVSIDRCANTSAVYGAYLKEFKKSAMKSLFVRPIHTDCLSELSESNSSETESCEVYNQDINTLSSTIQADIVYLDPPYNGRQYSGNYSPLNFIARYDRSLEVKGKTGLLKDKNISTFCLKSKVKDEFKKLIHSLDPRTKYIILSYNDEGLLTIDELKTILMTRGDVHLYKIEYKKFKSNMRISESKNVYELLWIVQMNDFKRENKYFETTY